MYFAVCFDELSAREKGWHDINETEMKKFWLEKIFGLIFLMGVIQKPKIQIIGQQIL